VISLLNKRYNGKELSEEANRLKIEYEEHIMIQITKDEIQINCLRDQKKANEIVKILNEIVGRKWSPLQF